MPMAFIAIGFLAGLGTLIIVHHTSFLGYECYYVGEMRPDTTCVNPIIYYGWMLVVISVLGVGFYRLAQQRGIIVSNRYEPARSGPYQYAERTAAARPTPVKSAENENLAYDRKKWAMLKEYDTDLSSAASSMVAYGTKYEHELASSYLAIDDKAYLPAIVERLTSKAEAEIASSSKYTTEHTALREFQLKIDAQEGIDLLSGKKVVSATIFGRTAAFKDAVFIKFEDETIELRSKVVRRAFANETELEEWIRPN